jgi:hypothetical protein
MVTAAHFRVRYRLAAPVLDPMRPPEPFRVCHGEAEVTVTFFGEVRTIEGVETWVNLCDAESEIDASAVYEMLSDLSARRLPPGASAIAPDYVRGHLDADGRSAPGTPLPIRFLPDLAQNALRPVEDLLFDSARRVVAVARWRMGIPGVHQPLTPEARFWQPHDEWFELPYYVPPPQHVSVSGMLGQPFHAEIEALLGATDEPLAQEFWREASVQRYENPRSALALGVASVEAGLLHAIRELADAPGWSRGEGHTPRFAELLAFVPRIAGQQQLAGKPVMLPESLLDVLRLAHQRRNDLLHRGVFRDSREQVDESLDGIRNFLLLLDFYRVPLVRRVRQRVRQRVRHGVRPRRLGLRVHPRPRHLYAPTVIRRIPACASHRHRQNVLAVEGIEVHARENCPRQ